METRPERPVVRVDEVHKWYRSYAAPADRLRRALGLRSKYVDYRALEDVSFEVQAGSAVGIIGENGAGKSTLLKLIAGTTAATHGQVHIEGRIAAILELGAAFHPEFTGRENALLYGSLVGHSSAEMASRLDEIFAFAELGRFIEHPVKTYSTGMAMRLAFAVATHVDPDVLIVDEALAVGDGYFQKKCIDRILAIKEGGCTVLFCTHAMYYVTMFCDRALWLHDGGLRQDGPAHEVVEAYERHLLMRDRRRLDEPEPPATVDGRRVGRITDLRVDPTEHRSTEAVALRFEVDVESVDPAEPYHVGVSLDTLDGKCVLAEATFLDGCEPLGGATTYRVVLEVPELKLAGGSFSVTAYLLDVTGLHVHDQVGLTDALAVRRDRWHPALIEPEHRWHFPSA